MVTSWTIAVDAMGGDFAPRNVAQGAVAASREYGVSLSLAGRENDLRRELSSAAGSGAAIEIVDAPEVVDMDEPACPGSVLSVVEATNASTKGFASCPTCGGK